MIHIADHCSELVCVLEIDPHYISIKETDLACVILHEIRDLAHICFRVAVFLSSFPAFLWT